MCVFCNHSSAQSIKTAIVKEAAYSHFGSQWSAGAYPKGQRCEMLKFAEGEHANSTQKDRSQDSNPDPSC